MQKYLITPDVATKSFKRNELTKQQQAEYKSSQICHDLLPVGFTSKRKLTLKFLGRKKLILTMDGASIVEKNIALSKGSQSTAYEVTIEAWTSKESPDSAMKYTLSMNNEPNPPASKSFNAAYEALRARHGIISVLRPAILFGHQCRKLQTIFYDLQEKHTRSLQPEEAK